MGRVARQQTRQRRPMLTKEAADSGQRGKKTRDRPSQAKPSQAKPSQAKPSHAKLISPVQFSPVQSSPVQSNPAQPQMNRAGESVRRRRLRVVDQCFKDSVKPQPKDLDVQTGGAWHQILQPSVQGEDDGPGGRSPAETGPGVRLLCGQHPKLVLIVFRKVFNLYVAAEQNERQRRHHGHLVDHEIGAEQRPRIHPDFPPIRGQGRARVVRIATKPTGHVGIQPRRQHRAHERRILLVPACRGLERVLELEAPQVPRDLRRNLPGHLQRAVAQKVLVAELLLCSRGQGLEASHGTKQRHVIAAESARQRSLDGLRLAPSSREGREDEGLPVGAHGGQLHGACAAVEEDAPQKHLAKARLRQPLAAVGGERAQVDQNFDAVIDGERMRRIHGFAEKGAQPVWLVRSAGRQLQALGLEAELLQRGPAEFRLDMLPERLVAPETEQMPAAPRAHSPRPAPPLLGRSLGHPADIHGAGLDVRVVRLLLDATAVHDEDHLGHGDGGFRNVRRDDDLVASPRNGPEDFLLLLRGDPRVQRQQAETARVAKELMRLQRVSHRRNLLPSRHENQGRALLVLAVINVLQQRHNQVHIHLGVVVHVLVALKGILVNLTPAAAHQDVGNLVDGVGGFHSYSAGDSRAGSVHPKVILLIKRIRHIPVVSSGKGSGAISTPVSGCSPRLRGKIVLLRARSSTELFRKREGLQRVTSYSHSLVHRRRAKLILNHRSREAVQDRLELVQAVQFAGAIQRLRRHDFHGRLPARAGAHMRGQLDDAAEPRESAELARKTRGAFGLREGQRLDHFGRLLGRAWVVSSHAILVRHELLALQPPRLAQHVLQEELLHGERGRSDRHSGDAIEDDQEELRVLVPLVHFVDDDVGDCRQRRIRRQAAQQHTRRHEGDLRRFRGGHVHADGIPDDVPDRLKALFRNALGHANGTDSSGLRHDHVAARADARIVQQELRHLGALATARATAHHDHLVARHQVGDHLAILPGGQPRSRLHLRVELRVLLAALLRQGIAHHATVQHLRVRRRPAVPAARSPRLRRRFQQLIPAVGVQRLALSDASGQGFRRRRRVQRFHLFRLHREAGEVVVHQDAHVGGQRQFT
eukprot:scaffold748_cov251-Pinguiococcus_pyrenoidosus.AAC.34